jgi:L-threonylcarbamoyladenylate synthase
MPAHWIVSARQPDLGILREAADLLHQGGIIAYPTDTLYGLAADPWQKSAVSRIFQIKGRDANQAIPLIAADVAQIAQCLGVLSPLAARLAQAFWPGPLTMVMHAPASLPRELVADGSTVAVRVPAHAVSVGLARALGVPVTATSANRSGQPSTSDPDLVLAALGDDVDAILDAGISAGGSPSTIIDARGDEPQLLRDGAVPWKRVVQFLSS